MYGATPAGITAAIQCRRMGKSAMLVEFGRHVGGMTSSGLSKTDGGQHAAGIATEFYKVVGKSGFQARRGGSRSFAGCSMPKACGCISKSG